MINLDYHKGKPCPYKEITCQEGYCSNCAIYNPLQLETITLAKCPHCNWQGKVEECIHKKEQEVTPQADIDEYIIDICPVCKSEVTYL